LALEQVEAEAVTTRWSDALGSAPVYQLDQREGQVHEIRSIRSSAPPEAVYRQVSSLGGDRGWLVWRWAWWLRGLIDRLVGGPGLRRGRRHPRELYPGDALDFWRVEVAEPPTLLCLRAEMRLPGRAWLHWEILPDSDGSRLVQTAVFAPVGLAGIIYWKLLYPIHTIIFSALVRAIAREAEEL
jgi:hypothetical protein